jgi:serine/threonine-protein kinase
VRAVLHSEVLPPSALVPEIPSQLDALVSRGLSRQRDLRFATAREMALVLEREVGIATQSEVSDWLHGLAGELLEERAAALVALRKRAQGRDQEAARERGTRRLAATVTASALTRAQAVPERAGEGARSGTRVRRPALLLFGLALLALLSGGAWLASALHSAQPMPVTPPVHAPPVASAGRAAPTAPPVEAHGFAREQDLEAVPSVKPQASRGAPRRSATTGGPVASKSDSSRSGSPAKATPEKVRAARKRVDCSQPYEVDAQGIRRWKRQCL